MSRLAYGQASPPTGAIKGWVNGPDGKPLAGVTVAINWRPDKLNPATPFQASGLTGADGSFTVNQVPNGTYAVCPHPPNRSVLAPCNWAEPRVVVNNGQGSLVAPITLQTGIDFHIRVNDPNGNRAKSEGKNPGSALLFAIQTRGGRMFPIPLTARDAGGYDHHLLVPAGTDLIFTASGSGFSLTHGQGQGQGQAVDPQHGLAVIVNVPAGQTQHQEIINIQ